MTAYLASDVSQFGQLRLQAQAPTAETAREVAGHFEGLFVQMMLKSMREASLGDGGLFDGPNTKMFTEMFDQQIAAEISTAQGLGLGDMVVRQLGFEAPALQRTNPIGAVREVADTRWRPDGPREFVDRLWAFAQSTAEKLGTSARGILAQAALETGWGQRMPSRADGVPSLNLFGIKADSSWQGGRLTQKTLEFRDGIGRQEQAQFRVYDSFAHSFDDYAKFLGNSVRYEGVRGSGEDHVSFARELQDAGYATDPNYASKIIEIVENTLGPLLPR